MIIDRPEANKLAGLYRGVVLQHLTHGRLKVWIPTVNPPELSARPECLPPAEQLTPSFAGSNSGNGVFSYPNIGAKVICQFINGDQNLPIVVGCTLGGENAFGQYELIKGFSEDKSKKHLITSGKSQIEVFESGKISAVVADPIRTDATVSCQSDVRNLSGEYVTGRPVIEKVDAKEISSINCQFVMDNDNHTGEISTQTYRYDTKNELCNVFLSAQNMLSNTIDKRIGTTRTVRRQDNDGYIGDTQVSSVEMQFLTSTTDLNKQINETSSIQYKIGSSTEERQTVIGQTYTGVISSSELTDTYNYLDNNSKTAIVKVKNYKDRGDAVIQTDAAGELLLDASLKSNRLSTYVNSQTSENIFHQEKANLLNSFDAWENQCCIGSLSSIDMKHVDATAQYTHTDKCQRQHQLDLCDGYSLQSDTNDTDTKIIAGDTTVVITKNIGYNKADTTLDKSSVKAFSKYYKKTIRQSTETTDHVECVDIMDAKASVIEIKITNVKDNKTCSVKMDGMGNIDITASASINFKAPTITFTGDNLDTRFGQVSRAEQKVAVKGSSYSAQFTSISENGSTVKINGSGGDAVINGVSLLNHAHIEMQAGDVVVPAVTKTQTAKASS